MTLITLLYKSMDIFEEIRPIKASFQNILHSFFGTSMSAIAKSMVVIHNTRNLFFWDTPLENSVGVSLKEQRLVLNSNA